MPRKRSPRQQGGKFLIQPYAYPMQGAGFFDDFARGFTMPFKAINSIAPGLIGNAAGLVHPGLGVGAKLIGLGRRHRGAKKGFNVIKT